jgi:hypothetical protein
MHVHTCSFRAAGAAALTVLNYLDVTQSAKDNLKEQGTGLANGESQDALHAT